MIWPELSLVRKTSQLLLAVGLLLGFALGVTQNRPYRVT